jgi:hypothetical protein
VGGHHHAPGETFVELTYHIDINNDINRRTGGRDRAGIGAVTVAPETRPGRRCHSPGGGS